MNPRQAYALHHPLSSALDDIAPYRKRHRHPTGIQLVTILAVDR